MTTLNQHTALLGTQNSSGGLLSLGFGDVGTSSGNNATSVISLTQNVSLTLFSSYSLSSNLSVNQSVESVLIFDRSLSSTLSLQDDLERVLTANADNTLNIEQTNIATNNIGERNPAEQVLNLSQTVFLSESPDASSSLSISQSVNVDAPTKLAIQHPLGISDSASTPVIFRESVSQSLSFVQIGSVPKVYDITHNLSLTHVASVLDVVNTLNLTQNATIAKSYGASNEITVTHNAALEGVWFRDVSHSSIVGHSLTWYEDTDCSRKRYTPFQGDSTLTDISPPEEEIQSPQGSPNDTFSLYTPYIGTLEEKIDLRAPELDNRDRNAYTRVNRETRGGKLIVYSDPDWPNVRTMAVTIVGLTESQVDSFQSFTQNTLGQQIGVTDWEGQLWKGFITNPGEPATQDGKARWTITFEFEGERLDIEKPGVDTGDGRQLDISQAVSVVKV